MLSSFHLASPVPSLSLPLPTAPLQLIVVDPVAASPGDYTTRTEVATDEYEQAVIFDHVVGRRT